MLLSPFNCLCAPYLYACCQSASCNRAAPVDTVGSAFHLSLLFGEVKARRSTGLEDAWKDLQDKLASGYPPLFYGSIPYLLVYAAAGVHIQFGRLLHGQGMILSHLANSLVYIFEAHPA